MKKDTKNKIQKKAFELIQDAENISNSKDMVKIFLELMYDTINDELLLKEVNLVYIGTFKLLSRNGKKSNAIYPKVIYSKNLRAKVKRAEVQEQIAKKYEDNCLTILSFDDLKKYTLLKFDEEITAEQVAKKSFVYSILDEGYNVFKETFLQYFFEGYMIDMGIKILHIGKNKKYGYALSQKNKQAQLLAINKKYEVEIMGGIS